ncbi:MAG: 1-acyl-sn-glycerol-3-phosphate acyltransferase [Candidatus Margulisiibacteriota bacterium]|nr:MAG: acyl-phosphate glycerol 3-phosphate acyltransferase [Candidatus Margulisbacteria bacterium GWD2_39_127]OGI05220.1 MAG: acyl-phosphate glycerol 3-phosphate acyltransferase [Candidatus Margulisbacteria bacterium GWF2_38_17]OGI06269.1 MAG: acyl-phosphate glycerol 3-phosphate acyltransferase [Candidatus Margulisbacteria bacterium GWE2_39_32]PZM78926.1 MAG: 1-acyl-sn-glycerol-3-phosphate acyltransferase [Candidatus Margulisiibacteriota bacterium]HAR64490.1 1-acyl-sn-glycerol-3-phosphate acyl
MIRAIYFFIYFWWYLLLTFPSLIMVVIFARKNNIIEKDKIINRVTKHWAKSMIGVTGSTVRVTGEENVPLEGAVLFVSNHQGNFDIPIMVGFIDKPKAFISKLELKKIPIFSIWMKHLGCIFLDRKNARQSLGAIDQGAELLKKGYSYVVFPEGTRSKDGTLGMFKPGSFKLAIKSGVPIVPVTIKGSRNMMKKNSFIIRPAFVDVIISPPIHVQGVEPNELTQKVRAVIENNLR